MLHFHHAIHGVVTKYAQIFYTVLSNNHTHFFYNKIWIGKVLL